MSRNIDFSEPLSEDDARYVQERQWLLKEAEMQGIEIRYAADEDYSEPEGELEESEEDEEEEDEDDESVVDYSEFQVPDLKSEIARRNDNRENEDEHIKPASNRREDLVKALAQDDATGE